MKFVKFLRTPILRELYEKLYRWLWLIDIVKKRSRVVFRTLSNIEDETFFGNIKLLKAANYFCKKSSIVDFLTGS